MIVYSSYFKIDQAQPFDDLLAVIADWLSQKLEYKVTPESLKAKGELRQPKGRISIHARMDDFPSGAVIELTHGDDKVKGREWVTSIGLRQDRYNADIECSINLTVVEISPLLQERITPSRPLVVDMITKACRLHHDVPGREILELDAKSAPSCRMLMESRDRRFPIIVIAANEDGSFPVDLLYLQSQVVTLADIIVVKQKSYGLRSTLPVNTLPRFGEVIIVYPYTAEGESVRNIQRTIPASGETPIAFEKEIFGHISLYTNFINRSRKIDPYFIQEAEFNRQKARIEKRIQQKQEDIDYINFLMDHIREQETQIAGLHADSTQFCKMYDESEARSRGHEADKLALQEQIRQMNEMQGPVLDQRKIGLLEKLTDPDQDPTPLDCLDLIELLHPDKVVILDAAKTSAKEAKDFKYGRKLLQLLLKLVNEYRQTLVDGHGDKQAKECFGAAFAAGESETTKENRKAIGLRTFHYNGKEVVMNKHLKIGVKPSPVDSNRVHFLWDSEERKIVIGHCGEHLDLK